MEPVVLEVGSRRVFASSLRFPGWSRAARTADAALGQLDAYRARLEPVCAIAGVEDPGLDFEVVEEMSGSGATDFGVPDSIASVERRPLSGADAERVADLTAAAWEVFDRIAAGSPEILQKGPRGGGRDRDPMIEHVRESEASYARSIGIRSKAPDRSAWLDLRASILDVIRRGVENETGWPTRYAVRRICWHILDHAWEMQDKSVSD